MRHPDLRRLAWLALPAVVACADAEAVRVQLLALPSSADPRRLQLRAQVAGPLDSLRYQWFAVSGVHDPQVTTSPATSFTFAEGSERDRVSVEVWRGDREVARADLDVRLDPALADPTLADSTAPRIAVTLVPPYDAGGPDTKAEIAGRVTGVVDTSARVVLYARASDVWYVQPTFGARHALQPDGTWRSWTHTGTSYAVLLVRPGAAMLPMYDVLPQVGPRVAARTIVDGARAAVPSDRR